MPYCPIFKNTMQPPSDLRWQGISMRVPVTSSGAQIKMIKGENG